MKKFLVGAVTASALVGGSAAIAVINPLGVAGAGSVSVQAGTQDTATTPTTAAPAAPDGGGEAKRPDQAKGRGDVLGGVLDELVKDGTITQEQADKIKAKLRERFARITPGSPGKGGHPGGGGRPGMLGASLEHVATALGMTVDEVKTGLMDGKTVADLARAKGIDPQKVIDDLVAQATAKIDEAVAGGKIDAERAAKAKEGMAAHITKFVNEGRKGMPGGPGKPGGAGKPGGPAGPRGGGPSVSPPTTAAGG